MVTEWMDSTDRQHYANLADIRALRSQQLEKAFQQDYRYVVTRPFLSGSRIIEMSEERRVLVAYIIAYERPTALEVL